ncbi:MAG TPA: hypothetical protein VG127_02635 [Rubrobacteraceae bacterium]|nr:hypothetical protein [Rubrobacteraceae bacterium]
MLGSILLLVMAFSFIFFVARGCVATQESTQVRKYVTNADSLLSESSNSGNEDLQGILQNAGGNPERLDEKALDQAATRSEDLYVRALAYEETPPEFEDAHHYLVSSLGVRAQATKRLAAAATGDAEGFTGVLAEAVEDYRLSDSLVRNHYLSAVQDALVEADQQRDQAYLEEPEPFMDYEELGFDVAAATAVSAARDDPNALHGVEIAAVEVAGRPLYQGGNVVLRGSDEPVFFITVRNGGETPETGVDVEVILNTRAERQAQTATIGQMRPKGMATVEIGGFRPGELNESAEATVEAGPVEYEEFLENNTLTGTVTFGL